MCGRRHAAQCARERLINEVRRLDIEKIDLSQEQDYGMHLAP